MLSNNQNLFKYNFKTFLFSYCVTFDNMKPYLSDGFHHFNHTKNVQKSVQPVNPHFSKIYANSGKLKILNILNIHFKKIFKKYQITSAAI